MDPFWWKAIAAVLVALGAWVAWVFRMARVSTAWPSTPGRVLAVWYDEHHNDEIGDSFVPRIRYAYTVRGRHFEGHRLWYRVAPLRDHRESMHALRDISAGDAIDVHYDPARPQRAVLFPGADTGNLLDLFALVARVVMGVVARMLR
jgi:hypothetical protein